MTPTKYRQYFQFMKYFSCTCLSTVWGVASEVTCRFLPMSCRSNWRSLFTASKFHLQNLVAIIPNLTSPVFLWKYSARFYLQENFSLSAAVLRGFLKPSTMQAYLDEFSFRFNRRGSRARGMLFYRLLEQSVAMHPISYRNLVANPKPRKEAEDRPVPPLLW